MFILYVFKKHCFKTYHSVYEKQVVLYIQEVALFVLRYPKTHHSFDSRTELLLIPSFILFQISWFDRPNWKIKLQYVTKGAVGPTKLPGKCSTFLLSLPRHHISFPPLSLPITSKCTGPNLRKISCQLIRSIHPWLFHSVSWQVYLRFRETASLVHCIPWLSNWTTIVVLLQEFLHT